MKSFEVAGVEVMRDGMDPIRADIAELRHQMEIQFAGVKAELKADIAVLRTRVDDTVTRADLEHALLVQTRWMLGGLALVLTAILFKG